MATKEYELNSENTNTLMKSYWVGTKNAQAKYSVSRGKKRLAVFLDEVPADMSEEDINKILSQYKLVKTT